MKKLSIDDFLAELASMPQRKPHKLNAHADAIDALLAKNVNWVNITKFLNKNDIEISRQSVMQWHAARNKGEKHHANQVLVCEIHAAKGDCSTPTFLGNRNISRKQKHVTPDQQRHADGAIQKPTVGRNPLLPQSEEPANKITTEEKEKMIAEMRENDMSTAMARVTGRTGSKG